MKIADIILKVIMVIMLVAIASLVNNFKGSVSYSFNRIYSELDTDFEYKVEWFKDTGFTNSMNSLGEERWELVSARRAQNHNDTYGYECIFKKAVPRY